MKTNNDFRDIDKAMTKEIMGADTQTPEYYQWVNASEHIPLNIERVFIRNIQTKAGGMILASELAAMDGLENAEWLAQASIPSAAESVELELIKYWRDRCLAAEIFIKESPCDPDITTNQIEAYKKWQELNKNYPPSLPSASPTKAEETKEEVFKKHYVSEYNKLYTGGSEQSWIILYKMNSILQRAILAAMDEYASQFASASFSLEVVEKAFDAGYKHGWGQSEFEGESVTPNKEQFLTSIKPTNS